jgi:hypothetical protein
MRAVTPFRGFPRQPCQIGKEFRKYQESRFLIEFMRKPESLRVDSFPLPVKLFRALTFLDVKIPHPL